MDARLLTRGTNAALVAVVGMGAGHLLMPARSGASLGGRIAFVALVAVAGAVAGVRERAVSSEYAGRALGAAPPWAVAGAVAALGLAALAFFLMHG